MLETEANFRTTITKVLGRNLDEFIATRLGTVFALGGIAFALYGVITSTAPLEVAANSRFLAAAVLDAFVAIGSWVVAGATQAVTIGGVALVAILPWASVFAVGALIIGAALLIIFLVTQRASDPLPDFAKGKASAAGFYMPRQYAIDYFAPHFPDAHTMR